MLIIINGASGAGKTFLLGNLHKLKNRKLIAIKKYTTRNIRTFESAINSVDLIYNCAESDINALDYHYIYNQHLYGIDKKEITNEIESGNIPVIIIRSFEIINKIRQDFPNTKVLFVIGATGETLERKLDLQGRTCDECAALKKNHCDIVKDYLDNIDIIDGCIINCLYDEDLLLKQFEYFLAV